MNAISQILSKRYAKTLHKIHGNSAPVSLINQIDTLARFFKEHGETLAMLGTNTINKQEAYQVAQSILERCNLSLEVQALLANLIQEHRLALLPLIVQHLEAMQTKDSGYLQCTVYSSHPLQEEQKNTILLFVKQQMATTSVVVRFLEKPELISGIRIVCNGLMWESSIRKTLLLIKQRCSSGYSHD